MTGAFEFTWLEMLMLLVLLGVPLVLLGAPSVIYRLCRPTTRDIGVQAPVTYTEVKGHSQPRFQPLPETSHGAFASRRLQTVEYAHIQDVEYAHIQETTFMKK